MLIVDMRQIAKLLIGVMFAGFCLCGCKAGVKLISSVSGSSSASTFIWTNQSPSDLEQAISVASSADGTKLIAATIAQDANWSTTGYVYTSINGGASWTQQVAAGSYTWLAVASSSDGVKLAALAYAADPGGVTAGFIYTSTDSGLTWSQSGSAQKYWSAITSSADGSVLAATAYGWPVYISTDSGATWTAAPTVNPAGGGALAMSADGQKIAFAVAGGDIYTSADGGATWTDRVAAGSRLWSGISSSIDGTQLIAVAQCADSACASVGGDVYLSIDGGLTWIDQVAAGSRTWSSVAASADGSILAAAVSCFSSTTACADTPGDVYISMDGGNTWADQASPGPRNWGTLSFSADGKKLVAAATGVGLWTATYSTSVAATAVTESVQ